MPCDFRSDASSLVLELVNTARDCDGCDHGKANAGSDFPSL
jgi:hypothetical protein